MESAPEASKWHGRASVSDHLPWHTCHEPKMCCGDDAGIRATVSAQCMNTLTNSVHEVRCSSKPPAQIAESSFNITRSVSRSRAAFQVRLHEWTVFSVLSTLRNIVLSVTILLMMSLNYYDLQGRKINFVNSKTLVSRPSRALPLTCPNVENKKKEMKRNACEKKNR